MASGCNNNFVHRGHSDFGGCNCKFEGWPSFDLAAQSSYFLHVHGQPEPPGPVTFGPPRTYILGERLKNNKWDKVDTCARTPMQRVNLRLLGHLYQWRKCLPVQSSLQHRRKSPFDRSTCCGTYSTHKCVLAKVNNKEGGDYRVFSSVFMQSMANLRVRRCTRTSFLQREASTRGWTKK